MKDVDQEITAAINHIAGTIDKMRTEAALSINALAAEAHISDNTLKPIIRKQVCPSIQTLMRLCNYFDIPLWRLFLRIESPDLPDNREATELLDLFERLSPGHKKLLIYIAGELVKK